MLELEKNCPGAKVGAGGALYLSLFLKKRIVAGFEGEPIHKRRRWCGRTESDFGEDVAQ